MWALPSNKKLKRKRKIKMVNMRAGCFGLQLGLGTKEGEG
jgi:hypothetical protein